MFGLIWEGHTADSYDKRDAQETPRSSWAAHASRTASRQAEGIRSSRCPRVRSAQSPCTCGKGASSALLSDGCHLDSAMTRFQTFCVERMVARVRNVGGQHAQVRTTAMTA